MALGRRDLLCGAACTAVLLVLPGAAPAEDEPSTVRAGEHFRVVAHFDSAAAADQMLATVEAMWPHVAGLYGLSKGRRRKLLEVHLYRDVAGYERAEETLTKGAFKRNLAFAHYDTQTAHVAMQPPVSDEFLAAEGLPYLTRNLLLHEASHLVRYSTMANHRNHPDWFADGAAQWLKYETLRSLGLIDGLAEDPASARSIERAQEVAAKAPAGRILDDGLGALSFYERYASKRVFFTYLMDTHGRAMRRFVTKLRRLSGGGDFKQRVREALAKALGKRAMEGMDRDYARYVSAFAPAWSEVYRSLETVGQDWVQVAFPSSNAVAWRMQPVGKNRYTFTARVRLHRNYGKQANILLDRRDEGFVSVALTAGFGVTVFSYDAKKSSWQSRASKKLAGVDFDKDLAVRLDVKGSRLTVELGGHVVAQVSFPEREGGLTGPWGLGAQSGSAVRWSQVTVR